MGTQLLGLLCLLFGMAAFFGLWSLAIKNRSKTIETEMAHSQPAEPSGRLSGTGGYSLSPAEPKAPVRAYEGVLAPAAAATSKRDAEEPATPTQPIAADAQPEGDAMARTHLEIANQFFDMGDFEGAADMCEFVIENPDASVGQIEQARKLKLECA